MPDKKSPVFISFQRITLMLLDALDEACIDDYNDKLKAGYAERLRDAAKTLVTPGTELQGVALVNVLWSENPSLHVHLLERVET